MKKLLSFLLAILLLSASLAACADNEAPPADETTLAETTTVSDPPIDKTNAIPFADLGKYTIVRPENASDALIGAASKLLKSIDQIYSVRVELREDFFRDDVPSLAKRDLEIIIGNSNREESAEFLSELKINDYGYALIGKKLVIAGHTDEGTIKAVDDFIISCMSAADPGENFFTNEKAYICRDKYLVDNLSIDGIAIKDYRIVYPYRPINNEDIAAERIKNTIADISGFVIDVVDDREAAVENEIMVGNVSQLSDSLKSALPELKNNEFYLARDKNKVWISALNTSGYLGAAKELCADMFPKNNETEIDCKVNTGIYENAASDELTTMSFNIWVSQKTAERSKAVVDMILKYMPDTVGVQEASPDWMNTLKSGLGSLYAYVGVGRNGGNKGEYSAVFYLKDKFNLKESGTKWLSATPDVANTKFESSSLPRIMTYALLERKSDGQIFAHVNTHLEHTSDKARKEQIAVLLEQIKPLLKYPIVMTGDFNTQSNSDVYKDVVEKHFSDSAKIADKTENEATFPGSNKVIDFIFVTNMSIIVENYSVCEENINGIQPSDHRPILSKYFIVG